MPNIAISYRRSDSSAITGRIFDRLAAHYGENAVFMDVDNIPFGTDFRSHIHETLLRTDVVIAVIGVNWIGVNTDGGTARIQEKTDPVRVEIETALEQHRPIIPVLADGAEMPQSTDLPSSFGNFAFLNAAEVESGRDFRNHMDRLIGAIDRTTAVGAFAAAHRSTSGEMPAAVSDTEQSNRKHWVIDILRYFAVPLVLLLVAHHVIVNALNLNTEYLQITSAVVPFVFGYVFFWVSGRGVGPAFAFAIALGIIAVTGMTVSQSLNSGDPIMPQTRFEWWDNTNFAGIIALSFIAGHVLARALLAVLNRKFGKP